VARLDEKTNIGIHESNSHSDIFMVGKDSTLIRPAFLDETEDVVPFNSYIEFPYYGGPVVTRNTYRPQFNPDE
jgi:hypothetical protein